MVTQLRLQAELSKADHTDLKTGSSVAFQAAQVCTVCGCSVFCLAGLYSCYPKLGLSQAGHYTTPLPLSSGRH